MTAKDYLLQIPTLRNRIAQQCSLVDDYMDEACKATSSWSAVNYGGTDRHSRVETYVDKLIDREREQIDPLRRQLHQIEQEVLRVTGAMPEGRWRTVIEYRYFLGYTWERLAAIYKRDIRWVYELHGDALVVFARCSEGVDLGVKIG